MFVYICIGKANPVALQLSGSAIMRFNLYVLHMHSAVQTFSINVHKYWQYPKRIIIVHNFGQAEQWHHVAI